MPSAFALHCRLICCVGLLLPAACGLSTATSSPGSAPQSSVSARVVSPQLLIDFEYDAVGNLTGVEQQGARTSLAYDSLDRPALSTDALSGQTSQRHGLADALLSVVDARGVPTTYERDGFGDVTRRSSNDTGATRNSYDEAGNRVSSVDARGVTTLYRYDALNRLTLITHRHDGGADEAFSFTFDEALALDAGAAGRLAATTFPGGSATFTYDDEGRPLSQTYQLANVSSTTRYGYTDDGRLTSLRYPSGRRLDIAWDAGLPTGLSLTVAGVATERVDGIEVDAFGRLERWTWRLEPGPRVQSRASDSHGRLVQYPIGDGSRLVRYDAAGRVAELTHFDADGGAARAMDESFTYDALDRLIGYTSGAASHQVRVDATGNRTSLESQGASAGWTHEAGSNRLVSADAGVSLGGGRSYVFDEAGNMTGDGQFVATYGASGRMTSLTRGGVTARYTYDGRGRRVRKQTGSVDLTFVYDLSGHLLGEYDASGVAVREYVWLGEVLVGFFLGAEFFFIQVDHLGAPRVAIDLQGALRWSWLAGPFGDGPPPSNLPLNLYDLPLRFPGQYADAESGFFYNHHRDYDPSTGRYLQSDPFGLEGGLNTYAYVDGNPLNYVDPDGLAKLNLFGPSETHFHNAVAADPDYANILTVYAHGGPDGISDLRTGKDVRLDADRAAALIRESGLWKPGMPVLFRSCEVGQGKFIWELARRLGVPVVGATELVYARRDGDGSYSWETFAGWSRWRPYNDGFGRRGTWISASPVPGWIRAARAASAP